MNRNIVHIVVFFCLFTGFILWYRGNTPPQLLTVPTPAAPPGPNAFDDFNRAAAMLQHTEAIRRTIATSKPDDPKFDPASTLSSLSVQQQEAYVRDNAPALAVLRQGFAHTYFAPPVRLAMLMPYLGNPGPLARALSFDGSVAARRGDWNRTMSDSLYAIQLGMTVPQRSILLDNFVGGLCSATGRINAWPAVDHLSAAQAEVAARRLERIQAQRFPFSGTIQEEKWSGEATLNWMFRTRIGVRNILTLPSGWRKCSSCLPAALEDNILWTVYPKSMVAHSYVGYMDRQIQIASMPYPVARRTPSPAVPKDPIGSTIPPMLDGARFANITNDTYTQLLMTSLALRAYKFDHSGAYPASLKELAPKYLSSVPTDRFAASPLKYRLITPGKYLLYSVGPDGVDNHGTPTVHNSAQASASDTGDIVANVSRW